MNNSCSPLCMAAIYRAGWGSRRPLKGQVSIPTARFQGYLSSPRQGPRVVMILFFYFWLRPSPELSSSAESLSHFRPKPFRKDAGSLHPAIHWNASSLGRGVPWGPPQNQPDMSKQKLQERLQSRRWPRKHGGVQLYAQQGNVFSRTIQFTHHS